MPDTFRNDRTSNQIKEIKKENHLGSSPDHQGASTKHSIYSLGWGVSPLFPDFLGFFL
jgi:hypothetical protein